MSPTSKSPGSGERAIGIETVRERIQQIFLAAGPPADTQMSETVLLDDEFYVGRRFRIAELHVDWRVKSNELEVVRSDGSRERLEVNPIDPAERRAA